MEKKLSDEASAGKQLPDKQRKFEKSRKKRRSERITGEEPQTELADARKKLQSSKRLT
jgi:hypothetical protein